MGTPLPITYQPTSAVTADLSIDGHDITKITRRFSIDHVGSQIPQVFLELKGGLAALPEGIETDALIHVREVVAEDPADATLRFLEPLDAEEFERACLAALEAGGPSTFGEAALAVLRAYASGKPTP